MNPAPMSRDGKSSEEIRKSYLLWPRTIGVFNRTPFVVKANYDKMEVVDTNNRILFSFEPNDTILMEIRFVNPSFILIVEGVYIFPTRIRVFNLATQRWQFDYIPFKVANMMEPCVGIHPNKPLIALNNDEGIIILDVTNGQVLSNIQNQSAETATFCSNGEIVYWEYGGIVSLRNKAGDEKIILDLSSKGEYGTHINAVSCFHNSNNVLIAPVGLDMIQYNLQTNEVKNLMSLKYRINHIEISPDDNFLIIELYKGGIYLLELKTGREIFIEDCMIIDTTFWYDGYLVVLGEKGIRELKLNSII